MVLPQACIKLKADIFAAKKNWACQENPEAVASVLAEKAVARCLLCQAAIYL
jgi:hypothetical protein